MVVFSRLVLALSLFAVPAFAKDAPPNVVQQSKASIYADTFQGRVTASDQSHEKWALTAASSILPLGALVTVTNLDTGKAVQVEINDRGSGINGRVIDLSRRAATRIGLASAQGVAPVRVEAYASRQPTLRLIKEVGRLAKAQDEPAEDNLVPRAALHAPAGGRYGQE